MQILFRMLAPVVLVSLSACAAKMPLSADRPFVTEPNKGLVVFKLTTRNQHRTLLLKPFLIELEGVGIEESFKFAFEDPERKLSDTEQFYIGSFSLPPGTFCTKLLRGITETAFYPLPTTGQFAPSFKRCFSVRAGENLYTGHVTATLIEKTSSDQERAGSIWPLADQLATGISSGTFTFSVEDNYDKDTEYIKHRFPALAQASFRKEIMSEDVHPIRSESLVVVPSAKRKDRKQATAASDSGCSVEQVLKMKELGLSDVQIKRSCGS